LVGPLVISMGSEAVPMLTELLQHRDEKVASWASSSLVSVGPSALPALVELLDDPQGCYRAAYTVGLMGDAADPAVRYLVGSLRSATEERSPQVRSLIATAGQVCVPRLVECLRDADAKVRWRAAAALEACGQSAAAAVPSLMSVATRDPDAGVRIQAQAAVRRIRGG
jgi:HEAT repeat protein